MFSFKPLRARLAQGGPFHLFSFFVLPVFLAAGVSGVMTWRAMTETALSRRRAMASQAAITLKERMDRFMDLGVSLATRVQFRKLAAAGKWEDAVAIMQGIPQTFPAVERVLLTDVQGVLRADVPSIPGARGTSGALRDWYKTVSATWVPHVSEAYRRAIEPRINVVAVAVPVLAEDKKPLGILVLQVKLDTLLAWSREIGERGMGEAVFVVDQHGHGASHPRYSSEADIPDLSRLEPVRLALAGGSGTVVYGGLAGDESMVASYAPVEHYGWAVVAEQSSAATFRSRNRAVGGLLLFFAGIALLNGILAGLVLSNGRRLREQGDLLKAILDSAGEGIVVADLEGKFTLWNPAATRLVGLGAAPVGKEAWSQYYGAYLPDRKTPFPPEKLALSRALKGESTDDEEEFLRNPGHPEGIHLNVNGRPLMDARGKIMGGVVIFRDITFQRESEAALRESEEKFRAVVGSAGDGIISADGQGRVITINRAGEEMFGRTADEILGNRLTVLMPERFHRAHEQGFARFLSGGEPKVVGRTVELVGLHKDGVEFPIELSISFWKVRENPFFTAVIRNITERKKSEDEIKALNRDLQGQAAELRAANRELESFSYSVSHDLRSPLRGIDGFSQSVLEDEGHKLSPEGRDALQRVRAATQRMGRLIDDMLTLSRVTRKELAPEDVDLSALAREVVDDLMRQQPDRVADVRVADGLSVRADKLLVRGILENLLGNAWKFTSRTRPARIEFGVQPGEGPTVYFVKDNGAGFDMAYVGKLFGAFQRLHAATDFPGTGVGLATVQRVIHKHGGRVWAEGAEGKGATFFFTLEPPAPAKVV